MNGPTPDQLFSYLSPESRKTLSAVQQQRQQEAAQFGAQLEQQSAALAQQKAIDDEKYNQYIANAPAYNDLRHDAAREKALRYIGYGKQMLILNLQGQPKDRANAQLQSYDDEAKMRYSTALKPFSEIEEGKTVVSNWKALQPNAEKRYLFVDLGWAGLPSCRHDSTQRQVRSAAAAAAPAGSRTPPSYQRCRGEARALENAPAR